MPTIPLLTAPENLPSAQLTGNLRPTMQRPATVSPTLTSPVRANPDMYSGQFAALGRVGEGLVSWGDLGFRVKAAQDYAALTRAETSRQAAFESFQTELSDPTNPENGDESTYLPRWQDRLAATNEQIGQDPAIQKLSAAAKLHFQTAEQSWDTLSSTKIQHSATLRSLRNAEGSVIADYDAKLRSGDREGAIKAVNDAVPFGIIHQDRATQLVESAQRKADHYQASALILQDPIAADGALNEKDKDGRPVNFTHLDDDSRLTLTFEAHRRAVQLRTETAADLFERQQQGAPAGPDEVNALVSTGRLTPAQAKAYLKPPKPEFDPVKFASLMTDISTYDPTKDGDRVQYSKLMARAAYDADIKGPAASDAVEMLKRKADPKSELNTPVARDSIEAVNSAFAKGLYGQFNMKVPLNKDGNPAAPGEMPFGYKTEVNKQVYAQAMNEKLRNLDALTRWLQSNPDATREDAYKFVSSLHETAIATQGANLLGTPARQPAATPTQSDLDRLLNEIGYKPKGTK